MSMVVSVLRTTGAECIVAVGLAGVPHQSLLRLSSTMYGDLDWGGKVVFGRDLIWLEKERDATDIDLNPADSAAI